MNEDGLVNTMPIKFYLKSKEFNDSGVSKKKCLKELWFSYDLEGKASIKIFTNDDKEAVIAEALSSGNNKVQCILVPYTLENVDNYTIEVEGEGNITIKQMERKFRVKRR